MKKENEAMEEVALVASEQQKFQKSIKGIKKLIKSGKIAPRTDEDAKTAKRAAAPFPRKEKKPRKEKGLVYISHIPHGFYENEMTQYFRQFGVVTNARVLRSRKTGRSKGAAFVEFLEPAVAEIVAETMNNYLMGKRLLKAVLVPPEKQKKKAFRKNWNTIDNPSSDYRRKMKKIYNENGSDSDDLKLVQKQLKLVSQTKRKLKELGIDYDFFQPVDVPEKLMQTLIALPQNGNPTESLMKEESRTRVSKKAVKRQKITQEKRKKDDKAKKEQKKAVNVTKNQKVEQNIKSENKKAETKKPKFEGQDFIKISTEKKSKNNKKQDQISEESGDTNDEFDSDAFDELGDSDEFESGDQSEDESGDEDKPSDESDDDKSLKITSDDSSEENGSKLGMKKKSTQSNNKSRYKAAQSAKENGVKRKMDAKDNGGKGKMAGKLNGGKNTIDAKENGAKGKMDAKENGIKRKMDAKENGAKGKIDAKENGVKRKMDAKENDGKRKMAAKVNSGKQKIYAKENGAKGKMEAKENGGKEKADVISSSFKKTKVAGGKRDAQSKPGKNRISRHGK